MMDRWMGCKWHGNDVRTFAHFSPRSKLFKYCHVNKNIFNTYGDACWFVSDRRDQEYFALNGFETIYYSPNKSNLKAICN